MHAVNMVPVRKRYDIGELLDAWIKGNCGTIKSFISQYNLDITKDTCRYCMFFFRGVTTLEQIHPGAKEEILSDSEHVNVSIIQSITPEMSKEDAMNAFTRAKENNRGKTSLADDYKFGELVNEKLNSNGYRGVCEKLGESKDRVMGCHHIYLALTRAESLLPGTMQKLLSGEIKIGRRKLGDLAKASDEEVINTIDQARTNRVKSCKPVSNSNPIIDKTNVGDSFADLVNEFADQLNSSLDSTLCRNARYSNPDAMNCLSTNDRVFESLNKIKSIVDKYETIIKKGSKNNEGNDDAKEL